MPEFISRGDAFALVESLGYEAVAELGNTTVFASTQAPLEEGAFHAQYRGSCAACGT